MEFVIDFPPYTLTISILHISMVLGVLASMGTYFLFVNKKIKIESKEKIFSYKMIDRFVALPIFLVLFSLQPIITMSYHAAFGDYLLVLEPLTLFIILFILNLIFRFKANIIHSFSTIIICSLAYQMFFRLGCFFSNIYIGATYFFGNEVAAFFPVSFNETGPYFPIALIEIIFMLSLYLFVMIKRQTQYNYQRPIFLYFVFGSLLGIILEFFRSDKLTTLFWVLNLKDIIYLSLGLLFGIMWGVASFIDFDVKASSHLYKTNFYMLKQFSYRIYNKGDKTNNLTQQMEKEANESKEHSIESANKVLDSILNSSKEGE